MPILLNIWYSPALDKEFINTIASKMNKLEMEVKQSIQGNALRIRCMPFGSINGIVAEFKDVDTNNVFLQPELSDVVYIIRHIIIPYRVHNKQTFVAAYNSEIQKVSEPKLNQQEILEKLKTGSEEDKEAIFLYTGMNSMSFDKGNNYTTDPKYANVFSGDNFESKVGNLITIDGQNDDENFWRTAISEEFRQGPSRLVDDDSKLTMESISKLMSEKKKQG